MRGEARSTLQENHTCVAGREGVSMCGGMMDLAPPAIILILDSTPVSMGSKPAELRIHWGRLFYRRLMVDSAFSDFPPASCQTARACQPLG